MKNFSYAVIGNAVYFREDSVMVRPRLNTTAEARVKLVKLQDCVQRLIDLQMRPDTLDSALRSQQADLNRLYDAFTARYGLINSQGNRLAFVRTTCSAPLVYLPQLERPIFTIFFELFRHTANFISTFLCCFHKQNPFKMETYLFFMKRVHQPVPPGFPA